VRTVEREVGGGEGGDEGEDGWMRGSGGGGGGGIGEVAERGLGRGWVREGGIEG